MTGFLGFDRRRVEVLLRAVGDLEGERARLGRDTWEAHDALLPYRAAVARLTEWVPRLVAILAADDRPLAGGGHRAVTLTWSSPDAIVLTGGGRWADAVVDARRVPARRGRVDPRVRARSLAILLAGLDGTGVLADADRLDAIATELGLIAASGVASAELLARLGPSRVQVLAAALVTARARAGWPRSAMLDPLPRLLDRFGAVIGAAWSLSGPRSARTCSALLGGLPPAALGPILAAATRRAPGAIPTDELVRAARTVLTAAEAVRADRDAATVTDGILAALATDGAAARVVLETLPDQQLHTLLVRPRRDPELLASALLASNDPRSADARAVAPGMQRVLEALTAHRSRLGAGGSLSTYADVPPHLGVYLGRWAEPLAGGWGRGPAWTVDHVGWLAVRPEVAVELLVTLDARYRDLVGDATGAGRLDRVGPLAYSHAAMADLVGHAELGAALADAERWDRVVAQGQFAADVAAIALAPVAPPVAVVFEGVALTESAAQASGASTFDWILGTIADRPEDVRDVLARQAADRDLADAVLEHVALTAVVQAHLARHPAARVAPLPADPRREARRVPDPEAPANDVGRRYHAQLDVWVDTVAVSRDPQQRRLAADVAAVSADVRTAALDARNHVAA